MSTKDIYQKEYEAKLSEYDAAIERMKERAAETGASARAGYDDMVETLRERRHEAGERLSELRASSDQAFQEMRAGIDRSWDNLSTAVRDARAHFG